MRISNTVRPKGTKIPYGGLEHFSIHHIKRVGRSDMPENHFHDYYEIYYLQSGERNYFIKDKVHRVTRGNLVFINEYDLHKTTAAKHPDHERILLYFRRPFIDPDGSLLDNEFSPFFARAPVLSLDFHEQKFVEELLYRMMSELQERTLAYETNIKALLLELLIFCMRSHQRQQAGNASSAKLLHKTVSEIIRYINENYASALTLQQLSEQFRISPFYLSKLFKKTTGFTFIEYVTTVRVKEAQRLLRETDRKVSSVMEEVGFMDFAHFGRVFKKMTYCSPLQYRKMYRL